MVLNLQGSSNVVVSNLEITDHESCVDNHCHGGACSGDGWAASSVPVTPPGYVRPMTCDAQWTAHGDSALAASLPMSATALTLIPITIYAGRLTRR